MENKLIQEIHLEQQMNKLLKQIEYQIENPIDCTNRSSFMCSQCIYNVGDTVPICANKVSIYAN